jgi:hypothetical protein
MGTHRKGGWARRTLIIMTMAIAALALSGNALANGGSESDWKDRKSDCGSSHGKPACDPYSGRENSVPDRYLVDRETTYHAVYEPFSSANSCVPGDGIITGTVLHQTWTETEVYSDGDTRSLIHGRISEVNLRATMRNGLPTLAGAFYSLRSDNLSKEYDNTATPAAPDSSSVSVTLNLTRKCDEFPGDDFFLIFKTSQKVDKNGVLVAEPPVFTFGCK